MYTRGWSYVSGDKNGKSVSRDNLPAIGKYTPETIFTLYYNTLQHFIMIEEKLKKDKEVHTILTV